jgi:hypothetical protein
VNVEGLQESFREKSRKHSPPPFLQPEAFSLTGHFLFTKKLLTLNIDNILTVENRYYNWTLASIAAVVLGTTGGVLLSNPLITGISVIASFLLYRKGLKVARMKGKTDTSKVLHSLASNLIEFLGIFSAYFFSPSSLPVVFAAVAVGFETSFHQMLKDKLRSSNAEMIGRTERIGILGVTLAAGFFNEYLVFYGMLLVGGAALVESGRQLLLSLDR